MIKYYPRFFTGNRGVPGIPKTLKGWRRIDTLLLSLLLSFSYAATARDFTYTYKGQTLTYTVLDENAKTCQTKAGVVSAGNNVSGNLYIPEFANDGSNDYKVVAIGKEGFSYCTKLIGSLAIPPSVTSIGDYAFDGCSGFNGELIIPEGVTSIGERAFEDCSGFTGSLTIPEGITSIGSYAFRNCSGFTGSLTIPEGVTSIGSYAFHNCSCFTGSLTIPGSVTSIGDHAFNSCSGFTGSLTIPGSVTSIGFGTFIACSGFTGSLTISEGVTSIGGGAFQDCSGFTGSLTIPKSVTSIGNGAFVGCSGFTGSLTLGSGLEELGMFPFFNSIFTEVYSLNPIPPTSAHSVFSANNNTAVLFVPAGSEAAYAASPVWSGFSSITTIVVATSVTLNNTTLTLSTGGTAQLTATVEPDDAIDKTVTWTSSNKAVTTVDASGMVDALEVGTAIITATTTNGKKATCAIEVKPIEVESVSLSQTAATLTIVDNLTLTPTVAPDNATDKTVTWSSSATTIASVDASGKVTALAVGTATITAATTNGKTATCVVTVVPRTETVGGLVYEIVPGGGTDGEDVVKVIGGDPDDDGVIRIPEEVEIDGKKYPVTEIGDGAFKDRMDITKVIIPPTVVTVGDEAFAGCTNLKEVEAEDGEKLLSCGTDAFKDCPIEELYLGRDTSGKPFAGNESLTSVTIGDKVTTVGSSDFGGCTSIVTVTVLNPTPPALADDGFEQRVYEQATLLVPNDSVDDYKAASGWKNFYDIMGFNEIRPIDIELELADMELMEGQSATLKIIITPDNTTDKSVTWTSSDATVATVNASGLVTALKAGKATITAVTANGLKATCTVTVTPKPSGIEDVAGDGTPAVRAEGGEILIGGDGVAEVYSLTGSRVAVTNGGRVSGLPRGIYLVRTNGKTYKVAL